MPYQLLIFEDNTRLRHSLELLLNEEANFNVAATYPNCNHAELQVIKFNADLVVMDIDMPGIGGVEGVRRIKNVSPEIKVVMHTMYDDDDRLFDSICAGADGYILKNTSPTQLVMALHEVMAGGTPMSPFVAQKIFHHFREEKLKSEQFQLTTREKEVLELLVKGNSYKMIADKASIGIDTVKKHLQNIYHKLHVNCGTEAVVKALRYKIVHLD